MNAYQQCIELPRAIATSDGHPVKGTKANSTKVYEKRYEHASPPIIKTSIPPGWIPSTVIMEGMFLITMSAPKNIGDYADFLLKQHILPHFRNGATEVHLLFDDPECQVQSPKMFERQLQDQKNPISDDHCCSNFTEDMVIPPKWRENVLNCRKCKRNLVGFLSHHFLKKIKQKLQRFVTAGGFSGVLSNHITSNSTVYTLAQGMPYNVMYSSMQLFVVLYACKFIDQMYQNYLQNKTREQLTISCGVVMTSSPLDSGSDRFSARVRTAVRTLFAHLLRSTWSRVLRYSATSVARTEVPCKNIERLFRKKEHNISQKFLRYKSMM